MTRNECVWSLSYSSSRPFVILRTSGILNNAIFFGNRRVVGQLGSEAWSQSSAIRSTGQTTWWSGCPASTRTTSGAGEVEAETPIHLTSTHTTPFIKQPSTRCGGTGLYSNRKTSATSMLLLMTNDQQPTEHGFDVVDGLPLTTTTFLIVCIDFTFFFMIAWKSLLNEADNCLVCSLPMARAS